MRYFSICFLIEEVCKNPGSGLSNWCRERGHGEVKVVRRYQRVITLVEAGSWEEAIETRRKSNPGLFEKASQFDVDEVSSPREWTSIPDCTFKYPPLLIVAELEDGWSKVSSLDLTQAPAAMDEFNFSSFRYGDKPPVWERELAA